MKINWDMNEKKMPKTAFVEKRKNDSTIKIGYKEIAGLGNKIGNSRKSLKQNFFLYRVSTPPKSNILLKISQGKHKKFQNQCQQKHN